MNAVKSIKILASLTRKVTEGVLPQSSKGTKWQELNASMNAYLGCI